MWPATSLAGVYESQRLLIYTTRMCLMWPGTSLAGVYES